MCLWKLGHFNSHYNCEKIKYQFNNIIESNNDYKIASYSLLIRWAPSTQCPHEKNDKQNAEMFNIYNFQI